MKKYRLIIISIILVGIVVFIFSNSLKNGEESNAFSAPFVAWADRVFDPHDRIPAETFNYIVRKLAHIFEFSLIGLTLGSLMCGIHHTTKRWHLAAVLFGGLAIAVTDEYIQSFTGRTSQVSDILIDFGGVLMGVGLSVLLWRISHRKDNTPFTKDEVAPPRDSSL